MIDRKKFFDTIRGSLFGGKLSPGQVEGVDAVLDEWERRRLTDLRQLAYMLATDKWETAHTMQPIREFGRGAGKEYGFIDRNKQIPYGRGLVQLTWPDNYERADRELGLNGALIRNYDLALKMDIAVKIMFDGMAEGWFTRKKLSDYITPSGYDFKNARRIVNALDHAADIAAIADKFYAALRSASDGVVAPPKPAPTPSPVAEKGFWEKFADLFRKKG